MLLICSQVFSYYANIKMNTLNLKTNYRWALCSLDQSLGTFSMSIREIVSIYTRGKKFAKKLTTIGDGPVKEYTNKEGLKTQQYCPAIQKNVVKKSWKTTLHLLHSQAAEVFQSSFTTIFL